MKKKELDVLISSRKEFIKHLPDDIKNKKETTKKCYLCGKNIPAPSRDFFCYGCREYICDEHYGETKFGKHNPEEHNNEEE